MAVQNTATSAGKSRFKFVSEIISELKKVVWLSRKESVYLTALVLLLAIVLGLILGACDWGFAQAAKAVFT
jgi:preprotein translocase subunit SecE